MAYTDRSLELVTVDRIDKDSIHMSTGWSWGAVGIRDRLEVGGEYLFETVRLSEVTGMATVYYSRSGEVVVDEWLMHKTDDDLEREHQKFVDGLNREREERWAANHLSWERREKALPSSLRRRIERFRLNGRHEFEVEGWGYELVVCELAVLYAASGQEDDETVMAYAGEQGTSGNQHDVAKMLSRHLGADPTDEDIVANSISALAPLTGNADYSVST